jgi:hypothetical protein
MSYKDLIMGLCAQHSPCPRPFAGETPTRIKIISTDRKFPFEYNGKFCEDVVARLYAKLAAGLYDNRVQWHEVDMNGEVLTYAGGVTYPSLFLGVYFPIPRFLWDYDRATKLYIICHRKLLDVRGKRIWVMSDLWDIKQFPGYVQMVMECSKNRLGRDPLTALESKLIADLIARKVDEWAPKVKQELLIKVPIAKKPLPPFRARGVADIIRDQAARMDQNAGLVAQQQVNLGQPEGGLGQNIAFYRYLGEPAAPAPPIWNDGLHDEPRY